MEIKKNLLGILLLPFCIGLAAAFIDEIYAVNVTQSGEAAFITGLFTYLLVHYSIVKPRFLATFAHELTHVLWGLFFRAKVRDIRIKRRSGFVNLSKTNSAIRLAPYFFPFFTVITILASYLIKPDYLLAMYFLVGFTLSLHLITTFESLKMGQPDIYKTGVLFALPAIFILNLIMIIIVLNFIMPGKISVTSFMEQGILKTVYLFRSI